MARYLNPQKISLLVLTSLYCDSVLPTSATVPVLSFITSHLVSPPVSPLSHDESETSNDNVVSIHEFEKAISSHPSIAPDQTVFDLFLDRLWDIDSLDSLHEFFDSLNDLVTKPRRGTVTLESGRSSNSRIRLSRTSPLGLFVRRSQLEFTRLQFHDASKLWSAFLNYRQPTATMRQEHVTDAARANFDINLVNLSVKRGDDLFGAAYGHLERDRKFDALVSMDDVDRLLTFQIDRLQRLGNRVSDDMRARLRKMLGPTSIAPSLAYFVRFFDAWRAGDYASSFDNLHRYFDYTIQTRDKSYYQYALLHMAILHADFGCFSEAIAAINETIATARENQDMICLNFSLSWLNHLAKAYPKQIKASGYGGMLGSERDGLAFLKSKAKDTKMWSLLSSTLLSEAKMLLSNGGHVPRAFEHIFQSAHLNNKHCLTSNIGAQMLMHASIYGRLGITHVTIALGDLLRTCYATVCPVDDILRSKCQSAFISCQAGLYTEAFEMLESISITDHRTLKFNQYIMTYLIMLKAKRSLRRSDTDRTRYFLRQLRSFAPSDPEIAYRLSTLEIELLINTGAFHRAFDRIEDLAMELADEDADLYQCLHLSVLKATLFSKTGAPEKGFSVAMRVASSAHRAKLWPVLWEAVCVIVEALVALGEFRAAERLGDAVIPQALEAGDEFLCARLYMAQADASMGQGGQKMMMSSNYDKEVGQADFFLDRAIECFRKVEDVRGECETLAKKALLSKLRADETSATEAALQCINKFDEATKHSV